MVRNLIFVRKMDDASVKIFFKKYTYNMGWGELVLMWEVWIGTLYNILHTNIIDGFNSFVVPESGVETLVVSREKTMLCH